jgi:uncharacterized repeat protein (TIGR01451 family)
MNSSRRPGRRLLRFVAVTMGVGLAATLPAAAPAAAAVLAPSAAAQTPQLSIAVDDNRASAASGDQLAYTITVRNLGSTKVAGLTVTQSVPTGLTFGSADPTGVLKGGNLNWALSLRAGGSATMHTKMSVLATPKELLRLAVVACAGLSAKGPPIVCASHSDQLPAGAAKTRRAAQSAHPRAATSDFTWWYFGGGLGLLILAGVTLAARRRRARATISA